MSEPETTVRDRAQTEIPTPEEARRDLQSTRIADLHDSERPREKLLKQGAKSLTDAELLAIFFRTGTQGANAIEIARQLLREFGSLQAMSRCNPEAYQSVSGIGPVKSIELAAVFEMAARVARERVLARRIASAEDVYELLGPEMRALSKEVLRVLLLDTRGHLLRSEEISVGSVSETVAHPREILRPALLHSATSFILVHNHPSGYPEPSSADRTLTRRVSEAADLIQIAFLDHVIIGTPKNDAEPYFSFREMGLL